MLIRRHLVYVDEESIRSIRSARKVEKDENKKLEELERKRKEIISRAEMEAKEMIENARKEAERILQDAKVKAESVIADAESRYKKEIEEYKRLKSELSKILSSVEEKIDEAVENLSNEILPLLKVIIEKILLKEIDEQTALRRLRSAISRLLSMKKVRVRVNPEDLSLIEEEVRKFGYELIPDPNLEKGDLIFETELGILDMSTSYGLRMVEDIIDEVI